MEQLTKEEIDRRMQEWRNIKVLHEKAIQMNKKLKANEKIFKAEIAQLKEENRSQKADIENLKLQVEELKQIIFGKKKKDDNDKKPPFEMENTEKKEKKKRTSLDLLSNVGHILIENYEIWQILALFLNQKENIAKKRIQNFLKYIHNSECV